MQSQLNFDNDPVVAEESKTHKLIRTDKAFDGFAIHCKLCGKTSYNHNDVKVRYCGKCNHFHDPINVKK